MSTLIREIYEGFQRGEFHRWDAAMGAVVDDQLTSRRLAARLQQRLAPTADQAR